MNTLQHEMLPASFGLAVKKANNEPQKHPKTCTRDRGVSRATLKAYLQRRLQHGLLAVLQLDIEVKEVLVVDCRDRDTRELPLPANHPLH